MPKTELKTKLTNASVDDFIESIKDLSQKADAREIIRMMERISGDKPKMWGSSIIGFVDTVLKYPSGRELDWFKIGFSPRKKALTLYGLGINDSITKGLLTKLGKHTVSKGCLYISKLSDVNQEVLEKIIERGLL